MIKPEVQLVPLDTIVYKREDRQRSELNLDKVKELAASIADHDLIHTPVVNGETGILAAGEHRVEAFKYNRDNRVPCEWPDYGNWEYIPIRYGYEITDTDMEKIELLENVRRTDMTWQDQCLAILRIHQIMGKEHEGWTASKTAEYLTFSSGVISKSLSVAPELAKGNEQLQEASGLNSAYKIMLRKRERAQSVDLNSISTAVKETPKPKLDTNNLSLESLGDITAPQQPEEAVVEQISLPDAEESKGAEIRHESFLDWAPIYDGLPFNFLHCDFPYGINHQDSDQGNTAEWGAYEDSEDTFFELLECLIAYRHKLILPSAHIMFWHSADQNRLDKTKAFIKKHAPEWDIYPYLMIWHKSDNKGIIPDAQRSGRNTYEVALQISVGDRKINKAVSMSYAGPSRKSMHASEKPVPMLHHFFRMFVDEYSRMLDPTCGSGSSVRAAFDCGAESALGLELIEQNAKDAQDELARHLHLHELSGQISKLEIEQ